MSNPLHVEFTGEIGEARGRNGWFTPVRAAIWLLHSDHGKIGIDISSKVVAQTAPIVIGLDPHDALALAEAIIEQVPHDDRLDGEPCPNCDDGCKAEKHCDGCDQTLCMGCWETHNNDAPCHMGPDCGCGDDPALTPEEREKLEAGNPLEDIPERVKLLCPSCSSENLDKSWFRDYLEDIECADCGWHQTWSDDHGIPRDELAQSHLQTGAGQ